MTKPNQRTARLFRHGRNQAVRIPVSFELPGKEVVFTKNGDRLTIEPKTRMSAKTFVELLESMEPIPDFPDINELRPK